MRRLRSIEKITADIFSNLKSDIRSKMALGDLFLEAKEVIGGDKEFGKWRSAIFAGQVKQRDAHNCMRIALCFSDGIPPKVPLSGLYILAAVLNEDCREDALEILAGMEKFSKSQIVRFMDISVIGPLLLYWAWRGKLSMTERTLMGLIGAGTVDYNGRNYLKNKKVISKDQLQAIKTELVNAQLTEG